MRPRAQSYRTLDGLAAARDAVPWYWRLVALVSMFMILGGFLMLPATFYTNTKELRVSPAAVGIFAVALLIAGFALTALISFAVRNPLFQSDTVFLPSLICSVLGLLTVFYDFLVYNNYAWTVPALLTTIAAAISTIIYAVLLVLTQRKISLLRGNNAMLAPTFSTPLTATSPGAAFTAADYTSTHPPPSQWQDPAYYSNYIRNMFPTSAPRSQQPHPFLHHTAPTTAYEAVDITEDEMQRQQMLQLLLRPNTAGGAGSMGGGGDSLLVASPSVRSGSNNTYNIDWQPRREDDEVDLHHLPPPHGYYAPGQAQDPSPQVVAPVRQFTGDLQPWDGVWRGEPPRDGMRVVPATSEDAREWREARRREIESGGVY